MRIKATVEYDGTFYSGWQIQPDVITVQEEIEKALSTILKVKTATICAGRTDAGVHAKGQVIHFDTDSNISINKLERALNAILPHTIAIKESKYVSDDFHARFTATNREYKYYITTKKSPLLINRAVHIPYKLDWDIFERELKKLIGTHTFTSFCSTGYYSTNHDCNILKAYLTEIEPNLFEITISADRFVYKMVRTIIGTLIDISRGKLTSSILDIINTFDRKNAGTTAPPYGLYFNEVKYINE